MQDFAPKKRREKQCFPPQILLLSYDVTFRETLLDQLV